MLKGKTIKLTLPSDKHFYWRYLDRRYGTDILKVKVLDEDSYGLLVKILRYKNSYDDSKRWYPLQYVYLTDEQLKLKTKKNKFGKWHWYLDLPIIKPRAFFPYNNIIGVEIL